MRYILTIFALAMVFMGCGRHYKTAHPDNAYAPMPQSSKNMTTTVSTESVHQQSTFYSDNEEDEMFEIGKVERQSAPASHDVSKDGKQMKKMSMPIDSPAPDKVTVKSQAVSPAPDDPMVVYNGYLHLRVKRLIDTLNEIDRITKSKGGYVESMTERSIVVRIPGKNFEEMIVTFAKLGDLLSKKISAIEVTDQYTDLKARLGVAEETKARLLNLLEKVNDARERLLILEEIKRLSEQIESIRSTLATLQNLLDYFTITVDLQPILEDDAAILHQSPFGWIRTLSAHRMTIFNGAKKFTMKLPSNFVLFTKEDDYRAQAADTTIIRGGVVDNNPIGDNAFWSDSISYEMEGRSEILEEEGKAGKLTYLLFKNNELQPRWYLIAVHVVGQKVYVFEIFFPNETAYTAHKEGVLKALETFEVKK